MFFKGPFLILMLALFSSCTFLQSSNIQLANQLPGNNNGTTSNDFIPGIHINGTSHASCAINKSGELKCWGQNNASQTGDGLMTDINAPQIINNITPTLDADVGTSMGCVIETTGTVKCWGSGSLGNGISGGTSNSLPVPVTGITDAIKVSVGSSNICILRINGSVECWGDGSQGQLGNGTLRAGSFSDLPTPASISSAAIDLSVGYNSVCAVLNTGTIECWGSNTTGQLGDGTTTERHLPVTVSGITNAIQISTSPEAHSCATLQDGTAKCWGYNGSYQLGDGTNTNSLVPVTVSGATGIKKITAGRHHTCALIGSGAKAGTVSCWGDNSYGQLGSPSTGVYPATVDIVSNATDLASGMYQNCVMLADQSVQCWGRNESGQVGVGSFVSPILTATTISGI